MTRAKLRLRANPIIIKELRSRMRGPRAFVILTAFLLLLGVFTYGLYRIVAFERSFGGGMPLGAVIGRSVFIGLAFLELGLVCLITPALTAGAISSEEERKTLDMLLATPLHAASVLWGKLLSALTYVFLLILAAVPMASIVFILGGVTAADMLQALAVLVLCAVTFGTLGLFFSVLLRRTGRAMVASYVLLLLLAFGIYFLYAFVGVTSRTEPPRFILYANPIAAMAAAVAGELRPDILGSMMGPFSSIMWALSGAGMSFQFFGQNPNSSMQLRTLWHYTAGIFGVLSLVSFLVSVQLLKPIRRWRVGRTGLAGLVGLLLLLAVSGYAFYGPASYERFGYPVLPTPTVPTPVPPFSSIAPAVRVESVPVEIRELSPLPTPTPAPEPGDETAK